MPPLVSSLVLDPAYDVVLGLMDASPWQRPHNLPNAWMASKPGVGLWTDCLRDLDDRVSRGEVGEDTAVETVAGPVALKACVQRHGGKYRVLMHSPEVLYPHDWSRKGRGEGCETCAEGMPSEAQASDPGTLDEALRRHAPLSHSATFWTHSWASQ